MIKQQEPLILFAGNWRLLLCVYFLSLRPRTYPRLKQPTQRLITAIRPSKDGVRPLSGVADTTKSVGTNDMVLGAAVGEDNLDFADFKKYFQRILKSTGHKYIEWIEKTTNHFNTVNRNGVHPGTVPIDRVYFFGHSMDLTDGDIIQKLVMAPNMWTTIYCYKKNEQDHRDMAQKIKNIQAIITRDELIKRTSVGGNLRFL